MIQPQTYLEVADNSGARKLMCIRVLNRQVGHIGDVIVAVVKEALPNMPVKKIRSCSCSNCTYSTHYST